MLTLQKKTADHTVSDIKTETLGLEEMLSREWLLSNERGGYCSSTLASCNTRRYHGLLTGSLNPPTSRIMALSTCLEMLVVDDHAINLSTFEFDGKLWPDGHQHIKTFRRDIGVHFDYRVDDTELTKSIYLSRKSDVLAIAYDFKKVRKPIEFVSRPFVGLRDFHSLQKSYAPLGFSNTDDGILIRHNASDSCELFMKSENMTFEKDEQWWFNFLYRKDKQRGQGCCEDLWTPGFFKSAIDRPCKIVLWASFADRYHSEDVSQLNIDEVTEELRQHQHQLFTASKAKEPEFKTLCLAADQFVTARENEDAKRTTILAGFPWFADWGRDAFISLNGLLLSTGRFEEAKSVLTTFAAATDQGMIPNRFDDRSDTAHFNSIDASLWFINASFEYLKYTEDIQTFSQELLPAIRWIVDRYEKGTRFGISADSDSLIQGGNRDSQLTWMDAKFNGVAFTPRYGKAVEINALWYNTLCLLAEYYADRNLDNANHYHQMADKVEEAFVEAFWNADNGYLNDCILPDGKVDASLRPNQIFAVSLPYSPLSTAQQKKVVSTVEKFLLTPYGLRTLSHDDGRYKGVYIGCQEQRDAAYHQGTVWPYLLGHFVEAYLKVNNYSRESKRKSQQFIEPLLRHVTNDGCLGSVAEIFDGDEPRKPKGCIAQAWSVAELLRCYKLLRD